ncbi:Alpha/Beta hydrolase protein [Cercophora scortea]|uniref:Alpha/Beta hydrolase protein n=1 Tax=Cercophora scortea TaxID=314031 RepID=A0AAE0IV49_9PEZI|nr:Alpha/Beta hydrolase protein [Cercophora scortea]
MQYESCTTNDNCILSFQTSLPLPKLANPNIGPSHDPAYDTCILPLHGFSGSSAYFTRNFAALSAHHWVVAPDMRGHGFSGRPAGGYHVARLAADLRELISHLRAAAAHKNRDAASPVRIVPVGCSIGAAVLWTYVELFGCDDFAGFVFVDQAPLQDRAEAFGGWDQTMCHTGCYDEATMLAAQKAWMRTADDGLVETHRGLVAECLGYRRGSGAVVSAEESKRDEEFFMGISAMCDGRWLARLLADHTRYDHREAIELITVPTLVMAGKWSGCFPLEGMLETARRAEKGEGMKGKVDVSVFDSGHWLFYEEPERFNREVIEFVDRWTA